MIKELLKKIYRNEDLEKQFFRYFKLIHNFEENFNRKDYKLFSSPGRTEIGGNHTDHNHGKVIAASINLDSIAIASANPDNEVQLYSEGYEKPFIVKFDYINPVEEEKNSTAALIRGVAAGFRKHGYNIGGFNACV